MLILSHLHGSFKLFSRFFAPASLMRQMAHAAGSAKLAYFRDRTGLLLAGTDEFHRSTCSGASAGSVFRKAPAMYYALGTVQPMHVSGVVILAMVIAVMAFWRQVIKAVIALLATAVIIGLAAIIFVLMHG